MSDGSPKTKQEFWIEFHPGQKRVYVRPREPVLAAARKAGVNLIAVCNGLGSCGACRIRIISGAVTPISSCEQELLTEKERADGYRLACQCHARGDLVVEIPSTSLNAAQRLLLKGESDQFYTDQSDQNKQALAIAIDVGTTSLAAYLIDQKNNVIAARAGTMNPQIAFGDDVMSRIAYANSDQSGQKNLQNCLINTLNGLIETMCRSLAIQSSQIGSAVVVGNTAMHHFFTGLPVKQLGEKPYQPYVKDAMLINAEDVGLKLSPGAQIYLPPNIAGFIGADHVAAILAANLHNDARTRLLLDIGTNTEISLSARGRLWSCSCASGPVFEGAHIHNGIRAVPGAIERVRLKKGGIYIQTIDQQKPVGICGSGILDAVAELVRTKKIDCRGRFIDSENKEGFLLVEEKQSGHGREIRILRSDINEIQLAKAAIRAGIEILLKEADVKIDAVSELIIAGAFGSFLDIESAIRIKMLPRIKRKFCHQVGNTAGAGARQLVLSHEARQQARQIADQTMPVKLTGRKDFTDIYILSMHF